MFLPNCSAEKRALQVRDVRGSSETFVRRIALDPTKNRISVLTDHPAYPSWNGVQRKAINVVGRVIWIGSQVS